MDYSGIDYPEIIAKQGEFINMVSEEFGRCRIVIEDETLIFYGTIEPFGDFARWEIHDVNKTPVRTL